MDAMVTWEAGGMPHAGWMNGCWEAKGRVARAGAAPRVVENEHLILVAGAAGARMRHRRRVAPLPPGELVEVDAGDVISVEMPRESEFRVLQVQPALLAAVAPWLEALRPRACAAGQTRLACCLAGDAALRRMEAALVSEAGLQEFLRFALGACAGRVRPPQHGEHAVVLRIRDYLREAFARTVTLEELGRRAGMCRFALARAFTREVGMPPHAYQTHVRILRACGLIHAGTPLSAAALGVGFSDQSHLCRHFKRIMGITPGTYAREVARTAWATSSKPAAAAAA
ncbi:AraC family transcriptional regulator [Longimicrobium sp.]|uniref:helix-turn-helix transcriptional regulator n=1 Tax=Longimicrobium sp. TaxID=2029185 RepID=UPI002E30CFFC|nr:AraC family transcriptional regulator [Longimicrobium sp.]HEX6038676.1 AraC family transcriptional regulator [Longimicrobium sp.]